ncbi:presqualene diphosphate synthase HpnD [Thiohalobacter sp.]|uniref:presqualene diphosphate synthase HpnD n=1 Tax=Thiohalobacter sp. TaxID=2025948 RepID=UPI0026068019|nr:presqualene diphosphate synthase HpnD [Thiohalobacter sp.]
MDPDTYCQQRAAASGSSFYYSFRLLPPRQRRAITALYAFCREVDDVVDECSDAGVARRKLDWWRDELLRLEAGTPQHPVTRALLPLRAHYNLPLEYLQEIIDGMAMDLNGTRYETFSDLALYCHRAAGVVGLLSCEIFGYSDRRTLDYAERLGTALQLVNIIRDVREDALRGRIYIPAEDLARFDVDVRDLLALRDTPELKRLLAFEAGRAREHQDQALARLPEVDRYRQRSGLVMAAIYRALLDEIERDGFQVMHHRVALTPLRKLWIAWRTARAERRRARRAGLPTVLADD